MEKLEVGSEKSILETADRHPFWDNTFYPNAKVHATIDPKGNMELPESPS